MFNVLHLLKCCFTAVCLTVADTRESQGGAPPPNNIEMPIKVWYQISQLTIQ